MLVKDRKMTVTNATRNEVAIIPNRAPFTKPGTKSDNLLHQWQQELTGPRLHTL